MREEYALGIVTLFPSLKDPYSKKGYVCIIIIVTVVEIVFMLWVLGGHFQFLKLLKVTVNISSVLSISLSGTLL